MKKILIGLVGAGGLGREVMPVVEVSNALLNQSDVDKSFKYLFVDDDGLLGEEVNGYKVVTTNKFFELEANEKYFNIAIGDSEKRKEVAINFLKNGCKPLSVSAPSVVIYDENEIGEGALICDNCIVTSNAKIGKFFQANIYSYVAHDCEIGDYVTFAPRVSCNGNVRIEDCAYIGTGAVLKQGKLGNPLVVGEGAVVGMGAVVTKNVEPYTTVVGNPAKPFKRK